MPNYAHSKIYQIISPHHEQVYVGSTTQSLCQRFAKHNASNNTSRSRFIIEAGDAYIELIEEYPCDNVEQLHRREGEIIRSRNCVNRQIAGRSKREWLTENKDKMTTYFKEYHLQNRDKKIEVAKRYYETNTDKVKAYQKAYRQRNKERLLEYQRKRREAKRLTASSNIPDVVSSSNELNDV